MLFLGGDAWQSPGGPPGGPGHGNPYGYLEAQRKRRRRVIIGLSAGTAVAVAAIVIIATTLGGSSSTQVADQSPAAPASLPGRLGAVGLAVRFPVTDGDRYRVAAHRRPGGAVVRATARPLAGRVMPAVDRQ